MFLNVFELLVNFVSDEILPKVYTKSENVCAVNKELCRETFFKICTRPKCAPSASSCAQPLKRPLFSGTLPPPSPVCSLAFTVYPVSSSSKITTSSVSGITWVERFDRRGTEPFELFRSEFGQRCVRIQGIFARIHQKFKKSGMFNIFDNI